MRVAMQEIKPMFCNAISNIVPKVSMVYWGILCGCKLKKCSVWDARKTAQEKRINQLQNLLKAVEFLRTHCYIQPALQNQKVRDFSFVCLFFFPPFFPFLNLVSLCNAPGSSLCMLASLSRLLGVSSSEIIDNAFNFWLSFHCEICSSTLWTLSHVLGLVNWLIWLTSGWGKVMFSERTGKDKNPSILSNNETRILGLVVETHIPSIKFQLFSWKTKEQWF